MKCSVCGEIQYNTPSGVSCANGHGGAEGIPSERSKATEKFSNSNITEVGFRKGVMQIQRVTLENPVMVMSGEELSIELISKTEAIVTIYNSLTKTAVNMRMNIKTENEV